MEQEDYYLKYKDELNEIRDKKEKLKSKQEKIRKELLCLAEREQEIFDDLEEQSGIKYPTLISSNAKLSVSQGVPSSSLLSPHEEAQMNPKRLSTRLPNETHSSDRHSIESKKRSATIGGEEGIKLTYNLNQLSRDTVKGFKKGVGNLFTNKKEDDDVPHSPKSKADQGGSVGRRHHLFRDLQQNLFSPKTLQRTTSKRDTIVTSGRAREISLNLKENTRVTSEIYNWERINQKGWRQQDSHFEFEGYSQIRLKTNDIKPIFSVQGPIIKEQNDRAIPTSLNQPEGLDKQKFYCRSISTYPIIPPEEDMRSGDPICDSFYVALQKKSITLALADGCNWGVHVRNASLAASEGFVKGVIKNGNFRDLISGGQVLLQAVASAHNNIFVGKTEEDNIGTSKITKKSKIKKKKKKI